MRILKFGGTSLADAERIDAAARRVVEATAECRVLAVASALAGVTDRLSRAADETARGDDVGQATRAELGMRHIEALHALTRDPSERRNVARGLHATLLDLTRDLEALRSLGRPGTRPIRARILAVGERLSAPLLALAIRALDRPARPIDATELIVAGSSNVLDARIDRDATRQRARSGIATLPVGTIGVATGFLAASLEGDLVLLGRGGSDTSATAVGAALDAERVEIWTDVDGVMSADPKRDPKAELLHRLTYAEAETLARAGAKVLHPRAVAPAAEAGIPIVVRNSFRPDHPGTWIGPSLDSRTLRKAG